MTSAILALIVFVASVVLFLLWRRNKELIDKYSPIIDAQGEVRKAAQEAERLRATAAAEVAEQRRLKETLSQEYGSAHSLYERLRHEISLLEENVEDISVGLYKPHYRYDASEDYKKALELIRAKQKDLIKAGQAAVCGKSWQVQGDKRAGERMTKQYQKLILRAFNAECDAAMAKVAWNNVLKMEERIRKTYEAINELGRVMEVKITGDYLEVKLAELRLEYETDQKKHEEQEEQRRIREQMREEERALREAEKARREAEEEESRNLKALEKARAELALAKGEALEQLQARIEQLDAALHKAQDMKEKATSMAQLTRSGHVYIISNVGSFGEEIYKIGMTRRLEPLDRVKELGDASVPFEFDVHGMVYSTDAPSLEGALQNSFRDRALNLVNPRKEFFRVSINEIETRLREMNLDVELTKLAEAREFRETAALRAAALTTEQQEAIGEFPAAI